MRTLAWDDSSSEKKPSNLRGQKTNDQLVIEFLEWSEQVRHRASRTISTYGESLASWVAFMGTADLMAADVSQMEAWVTRPRKGRAGGLVGSEATQRKDVAVLRSFYKWCWERDLTRVDLAKALHGPKVRNINPRPIPDEHWRALWGTRVNLDDSSVVALGLGFFCGLRRHEILGLTAGQVTDRRIIDFTRKGGGDHTLPWRDLLEIHMDALPSLVDDPSRFTRALENLSRRRGDLPLLTWPTNSIDGFNKRMTRWCRDAGVPHYTPHQLRHSAATNLLRAGLPLQMVSRVLNHSNMSTTMRYVRSSDSELAEWRRTHKAGVVS